MESTATRDKKIRWAEKRIDKARAEAKALREKADDLEAQVATEKQYIEWLNNMPTSDGPTRPSTEDTSGGTA